MKSTHRYYTSERGAKFHSGDKELILRKNDLFRLELYENRPSVIKDGVVYFVSPRLVSALKKRSEIAAVAQVMKARIEFLNQNGLAIEKAIVANTKSLISRLGGKNIRHDFKNNTVWLVFDTSFGQLSHLVTVEVYVGSTNLHVAAYAPDKSTLENWQGRSLMDQTIRKLAKYLTEKYSMSVSKIRVGWATYANIHVAEKPFSGRVLSYAANWSV